LLSRGRYTVELLSDYSRRYGPDAVEPFKLASDSPELIDSLDVLSIEHVPSKPRYIKTLDGSSAGFKMTRHVLLLRLTGGSARISQPSAPDRAF
jgi:hypothetical protein